MLGGVRSRLAAETNTEAGLHSQAQALTDMAQSLLSHVEAVQASAAENPDGPGECFVTRCSSLEKSICRHVRLAVHSDSDTSAMYITTRCARLLFNCY